MKLLQIMGLRTWYVNNMSEKSREREVKVLTPTEQREERCAPMAKYLIELLASQQHMPVGLEAQKYEGPDPYLATVRAFLQRLIDNDVRVSEVTYIFALARQAMDLVQAQIDETMNQQMNRNTEAMYGLAHNEYDAVTIKDLNRVVKRRHLIEEVWKPVLEKEVVEVPEKN